ncbi:MAG: TetR/AcrR family transcriptional regulator [Bacteriovoracaceae bacterium]
MSQKIEKTKQILNAAIEEFHSKGFEPASMHNIAATSEVSKRTLYKYYPTKDDLYDALIDEILNQVEGMYEFHYEKEGDLKKQISEFLDKKFELTLDDTFLKLSRIVIGELFKGRSPTPKQMERLNNTESDFLKWIMEAQKDKKITNQFQAAHIADQFHSLIKGQIFWPLLMNMKQKEDLNIKEIKESVLSFFMNSFCL